MCYCIGDLCLTFGDLGKPDINCTQRRVFPKYSWRLLALGEDNSLLCVWVLQILRILERKKKKHKINLVCDRKLRRAAAALPTVPVD